MGLTDGMGKGIEGQRQQLWRRWPMWRHVAASRCVLGRAVPRVSKVLKARRALTCCLGRTGMMRRD